MDKFASHAKALVSLSGVSEVENLTCEGDRFIIKTSDGIYESTGAIVGKRHRTPKNGNSRRNSTCWPGHFLLRNLRRNVFQNLDVAVIGGGDATIEEGLLLANIAKKVYIIHRRDALRPKKSSRTGRIKMAKLNFYEQKTR